MPEALGKLSVASGSFFRRRLWNWRQYLILKILKILMPLYSLVRLRIFENIENFEIWGDMGNQRRRVYGFEIHKFIYANPDIFGRVQVTDRKGRHWSHLKSGQSNPLIFEQVQPVRFWKYRRLKRR